MEVVAASHNWESLAFCHSSRFFLMEGTGYAFHIFEDSMWLWAKVKGELLPKCCCCVAKRGGAPWTGCVQQGSDIPRKVLDSNGGCCYIMFLNSVKAGLFVGLVNCFNM